MSDPLSLIQGSMFRFEAGNVAKSVIAAIGKTEARHGRRPTIILLHQSDHVQYTAVDGLAGIRVLDGNGRVQPGHCIIGWPIEEVVK